MGNTGANLRSASRDTAAIVEWKEATGPHKAALLSRLFRDKYGLIRQLTAKAARAEKTTEDMEDLLQAGYIGFQRALEGFDPSKNCAISTYAAWWIRKEVQRVAKEARIVSLPRIRLTNEERARAVAALREDPDVVPESIGIHRNQLEQVRSSIGVKFLSDDTPRGAAAMDRKLHEDVAFEAGLEFIEQARRRRRMNGVLARVRLGKTAEEIGITAEAYEAAMDVIREDTQQEERTMTNENETTTEGATKRRYGPKPGTPRKAKPAAVASQLNARERLAKRLAELDAERELVALMMKAPEDAVARVVAAFAA